MRRARVSQQEEEELEEGIERAAKRARIDAGSDEASIEEKLFGELLLHFTQLGPTFTYADWSRLTLLKKKFSGLGDGGEIFIAGWRALCFRDFESVVRTRDGRGPYQFLLNLEAHFIRRKLELLRDEPTTDAKLWIRGYWRRAYVVCGHFLREILDECTSSPLGSLDLVDDPDLVARLSPHMPYHSDVLFRTRGAAGHMPVALACAGAADSGRNRIVVYVPVNGVRIPRRESGMASSISYDPLVTEVDGVNYYPYQPNTIVGLEQRERQIRLEIPFGGPLQWRPIRWNGSIVAMGTTESRLDYGRTWHALSTLSLSTIDAELYWAMTFMGATRSGDNDFPAELLAKLPDEWKTREFEYKRLFMRGTSPAGLEIIVRDLYLNTESIDATDWVRLFCAVPGYTEFWDALPDKGSAWLEKFDRIVMTDHGMRITGRDPLRNNRDQLVIYKCHLCGGAPAAFAVLETGQLRCTSCAEL